MNEPPRGRQPRRIVLHVDMDAFYAAIEQRDDPALRGKPVIVGGSRKRGVVSTCSYEARPFGVHSAMPMARATRLCPQAVVVPVRMHHYAAVSKQIMNVLERFSPLVEPLSLDEAFLDMTGSERLFGGPLEMATRIKARVHRATRLTCSVGIARNKFLAKLASDLDKPDAVTLVPFGDEQAFIAPLPVRRMWGVGPRAEERLRALGLQTIGDLASADLAWLREELGALGDHIHHLACARDERDVIPDWRRKSVGSERTLESDVSGYEEVEALLWQQVARVAHELRRGGWLARAIRVKIRYQQTFRLATRDAPLPVPCDDSSGLMNTARELLHRLDLESPIRLVGAAAFDLVERGRPVQGDLFLQPARDKQSRVEHAMDAIQNRFGALIQRGSLQE